MRRGHAFSMIELLVAVAVVAILASMLLPALGSARRHAHRVTCAAHLAQMGHAFIMYASDHRGLAMPLAYTDPELVGAGPAIFWWGTDDPVRPDPTRGFLWPYLQAELREKGLFECPAQAWGSYTPQGAAGQPTSTYGYNGYFLSPPHTPGWSHWIGRRPWQNLDVLIGPASTFGFADTLMDLGGGQPKNNALLDPPLIFNGRRWLRNESPTTAFRHRERANVLCVDGHVALFGYVPERLTSGALRIGSAGLQNELYVPDWREW